MFHIDCQGELRQAQQMIPHSCGALLQDYLDALYYQ